MPEILYNIGAIEIVKQVNKYLILSKIKNTSFKHLLNPLNINYNYVSENEIILNIKSFQTLNQFLKKHTSLLSYEIIEKIILNLIEQINNLEKNKKTISFIDPNDIVVLDKKFFLFINLNKIFPIRENHFNLKKIYKKNKFMPPEIYNNQTLPKLFLKSACYYSVGLLSFMLFFGHIEIKNILTHLLPIYQTKIYFFILRCLNKDPQKRFMLLI